jgi:Domain of unknown function (DUF4785) C-terminal domain
MKKHQKTIIATSTLIAFGALIFLMPEKPEVVTNETPTIENRINTTTQIPLVLKTGPNSLTPKKNQVPFEMANITSQGEPADLNPIARIKAIQEKTALHESLLADHDSFTRYPEYNQKIASSESDPTAVRYEIDERTTIDEEQQASLTIWSDKKYYLHGDQAIVYASLKDAHGRSIPTQFLGQLIFDESQGLQQLEFTDSNHDGIYETPVFLNKEKLSGLYKVLIVNKHNKLADAVTFTLSEPEIQLSGNYRDTLNAQGNLVIEAEISVSKANRFYVQASLYTENNDPIGTTQYSSDLAAGKHWIPLEFDGLMIHDAQEHGPYLLKNLSLAKVALPIQRAPLENPEFHTQDYSLEQFRASRYASSN